MSKHSERVAIAARAIGVAAHIEGDPVTGTAALAIADAWAGGGGWAIDAEHLALTASMSGNPYRERHGRELLAALASWHASQSIPA